MSALPAATTTRIGRRATRRTGVIVSTLGAVVTVDVGGALLDEVPVLGAYQPVPGDVVIIDAYNNSWVILGAVTAPGESPRPLARSYDYPATGTLPVVATVDPVPGAGVVTALNDGAVYQAVASFRIDRTSSASGTIFIGRLYIDGVVQPGNADLSINTAAAHAGIYTVTQSYAGTLTAGPHVFELRASASVGGVWTVQAADSKITALVIG